MKFEELEKLVPGTKVQTIYGANMEFVNMDGSDQAVLWCPYQEKFLVYTPDGIERTISAGHQSVTAWIKNKAREQS
jgi:hypothetical protein